MSSYRMRRTVSRQERCLIISSLSPKRAQKKARESSFRNLISTPSWERSRHYRRIINPIGKTLTARSKRAQCQTSPPMSSPQAWPAVSRHWQRPSHLIWRRRRGEQRSRRRWKRSSSQKKSLSKPVKCLTSKKTAATWVCLRYGPNSQRRLIRRQF